MIEGGQDLTLGDIAYEIDTRRRQDRMSLIWNEVENLIMEIDYDTLSADDETKIIDGLRAVGDALREARP